MKQLLFGFILGIALTMGWTWAAGPEDSPYRNLYKPFSFENRTQQQLDQMQYEQRYPQFTPYGQFKRPC